MCFPSSNSSHLFPLQFCVLGRGKIEHPLTLRSHPAGVSLTRTSSDITPTVHPRVWSLYTPFLANALHSNRASSCHAGMQAGPGVYSSQGCLSPERVVLQVCRYSYLTSPSYRLLAISLAILTPNIPESGTKSRVETQVRVTVDLAHASTSAGEQNQYDRVGSWKWLKLPPGTSTKKRTRREGKIGECPASVILALALT